MPVTDDEVAVLRAHLAGDQVRYRELYGRLDRSAGTRTTYSLLITAAFMEAVERRFAGKGTAADVISYVADVRSRSDDVAQALDARAAERVIRDVLTDEDIADIDGKTRGQVYIIVLSALVSDEQLDDAGLDAFLAAAREKADDYLARRTGS